MHLKLSKSERISDWEIRIISGVSFIISTILMHWLIHLSNPDTFGFFELYMSSINYSSSAIVGGYFGPKIFRAASKEKYLVDLLKIVFFVLICETILVSFLAGLLSLFFRGDISFTLLFSAILMPLLLILYGKWKLAQIVITVSILFLGFRYIKAKDPQE